MTTLVCVWTLDSDAACEPGWRPSQLPGLCPSRLHLHTAPWGMKGITRLRTRSWDGWLEGRPCLFVKMLLPWRPAGILHYHHICASPHPTHHSELPMETRHTGPQHKRTLLDDYHTETADTKQHKHLVLGGEVTHQLTHTLLQGT